MEKPRSKCCCGPQEMEAEQPRWVSGIVKTPAGNVPVVTTTLTWRDRLGTVRVRLGIRRNRYRVEPGLYAVGTPTPESHVYVTANFKMSFDSLRSKLGGRDAWIMVLDTKGVNVWCSAGKGTFGTTELIRRAEIVGLQKIVSHRNLILPQLGATGVSAHEVKKSAGWRVIWGPVRSKDIPAFLDAGLKATPAMRRVHFTFLDRIELIPLDLVMSARYLIPVALCFFLLSGIGRSGYSVERVLTAGLVSIILLAIAYISGGALVPALLPYLPGRPFSLKGAWIGIIAALPSAIRQWSGIPVFESGMEAWGWLLLVPAISSYMAMNFTGASTYTSLSGVRREMRVAVPAQITAAVCGFGLWLASKFI